MDLDKRERGKSSILVSFRAVFHRRADAGRPANKRQAESCQEPKNSVFETLRAIAVPWQ